MPHINTNPTTLRARALRKGGNMAEALLWNVLRNRRLGGYKFTRQLPVGPYFADFACRERRLLIEVDGSQHFDCAYDRKRDEFLLKSGFAVIRVPSGTLLHNRSAVCDTILAALEGRLDDFVEAQDLRYATPHCRPTPGPSLKGYGMHGFDSQFA